MMLAPASQASTTTIEQNYTFAPPTVEPIKVDGQWFDQVVMDNCPVAGEIGQPALPTYRARILLPYGHEVVSVEATTGPSTTVGTGLNLPPVEDPFVLSTPPDKIPPLYIDQAAYTSTEKLPQTRFSVGSVQSFRGYRVLFVELTPVDYTPSTGELAYYSDIQLTVVTEESGPTSLVRALAKDAAAIEARVDNSAQLSSYPAISAPTSRAYDLLIICPDEFEDAYQPLKNQHDMDGTPTEIHTLSMIGSNDPHTIRNHIRDEYLTNGISMVLIGADDDLIPALDVYIRVDFSDGSNITEYDLPADFYYACLDGTFNYDGDAFWGEPNDGEGGGEIDLLPEVGASRISAESVDEVNNMVNKTLWYLTTNEPYLSKVLLVGEQLGFAGLGEYGGYAMDEMVNGAQSHGLTTCGFPDDQYDIDKLYDMSWMPNNHWPYSEIINAINSGVHIVDHLGHSYIGYAMKTDTSIVKNQLTNTQYGFLYAEGCSAGKFDGYDCWAEYVTAKLATGGFACMANARLGLGSRTTLHPVHWFNREFWDAVYNSDEGATTIGLAQLDARFDIAPYVTNNKAMRWTYYETTLFADPAVSIKSVSSLAIMFPDGTPSVVEPLKDTSFSVTVTGIGEGQIVPGSGLLHCRVNGSDSMTVPMTAVKSDAFQATIPGLDCDEVAEYWISVEETATGRRYAPDPSSPLTALASTEEVMVFEDNFETDQGWTTEGLWSRGVPQGGGGQELQYPAPDPTDGCDGPNVMGYNLAGDYENSIPGTHVTSPAIDCGGMANTRLRFCRWLGVEQPGYDEATVCISVDGAHWTELWQNTAVIADLEWQELEYDVSDIADGQSEVYLRWTMGPTDVGLAYCGWNIDNVQLVALHCESWICGDIDGSGAPADIADLVFLVGYMFNAGPAPPVMEACNVDGIGGLLIDIADLVYLVAFMFESGPEPVCQ